MLSPTSSSLTAEETIGLIEGWLTTSPNLTFKQVRADAAKLNVPVTSRLYAEAKRRLGITAAPPRVAPRKAPNMDLNAPLAPTTPLMNFAVEFLRGKPEASYQEMRAAGSEAGFSIAPINYGNARRILGMAAMTKRVRRRVRITQAGDASDAGARPASTPHRGKRGRKSLNFGNLSALVTELQDVVAERDRLLAALDEIAAIVRRV